MMSSDSDQQQSPAPLVFAKSGALRDYREELESYEVLTDEETRLLFQKRKRGKNKQEQEKLQEKITCAYLRFVIDTAESFTDIEHLLVDYIQEGNIALMEAIALYDYASRESFLDFCLPRIYDAIQTFREENPSEFDDGIQVRKKK